MKVKSLSCVRLFVTPWTIAYQAPPSMGFSRQEYWRGLSFPSPGDLPDPGIEPRSPAFQADALTSEPPGKPIMRNSGLDETQTGMKIAWRNSSNLRYTGASLVAQRLKRLPGMRKTPVRSLDQEDPLEKEMAIHSSTIAWKIPWTEENIRQLPFLDT